MFGYSESLPPQERCSHPRLMARRMLQLPPSCACLAIYWSTSRRFNNERGRIRCEPFARMCCVPSLRGRRRQEVQWRQDLEIPLHSRLRSVSLRVGKGAASLLLGLVDHRSRITHLDQSRKTERATSHVLDQTLDTGLIARWQKHGLIHTEPTVLPTAHVLDDFRFDLLLGQIQRENRVLPSDQQSLHIELGQLQKIALGRKRSAGQRSGRPGRGKPAQGNQAKRRKTSGSTKPTKRRSRVAGP